VFRAFGIASSARTIFAGGACQTAEASTIRHLGVVSERIAFVGREDREPRAPPVVAVKRRADWRDLDTD
jgi:hypothetical protein